MCAANNWFIHKDEWSNPEGTYPAGKGISYYLVSLSLKISIKLNISTGEAFKFKTTKRAMGKIIKEAKRTASRYESGRLPPSKIIGKVIGTNIS